MAHARKMTVKKKGSKVSVKKEMKTPYGKMSKSKTYNRK